MPTSTILRSAPTPSKAAACDPDVCLIDGQPCDYCRAAHEARQREQDLDEYARYVAERQKREDIDTVCDVLNIGPDQLPRALPALARLLLPHQAEGMAEIAGAVIDEREAAA